MVYLPDRSAGSSGIWRYSFNGSTFTASTAFNVAAGAGLGAQQPGAIALGSDGNLYASMNVPSRLVRVNTPAGATQTVDIMAAAPRGVGINGLAIVGPQLWIAAADSLLLVADPVGCGTACKPVVNKLLANIQTPGGITSIGVVPLSITFDSVNSIVYVGTADGVLRYNAITGVPDFYTASFVKNGLPGLYSNVTAVGVDTPGNLFAADDPTAGLSPGGATIFRVPAGSLPDGQGPAPTNPRMPPIRSRAPPARRSSTV